MSQDNARGFTLMEMLVSVAIIAILAAIAIPLVANLNTSLNMLKADSYAKEIYYAAQNRLASMEATGELDQLTLPDADKLTVEPADYAQNAGSDVDDGWQSLYRLDSDGTDDDAVVSRIMDAASVSDGAIGTGSYIIEFSPSSGEVYSVFYSEKTDLTYGDVRALDEGQGGRSKANRTSGLIGYYCGGSIRVVGTSVKLTPTVSLVNAEELYAHITCDGSPLSAGVSKELTATLTLTDEQSGNSWSKDISTAFLTDGTSEEDVVLDSMQTGESFAQITDANGDGATISAGEIAPGDDVTATVTVRYKGKGTIATATSNTENSLYQSLGVEDGILTAKVANVRQLDNLRDGTCSAVKGSFAKVVQTGSIDFDATTWSVDAAGDAPLSSGTIAWNKANVAGCPDTGYVNPLGAGIGDGGADGFTPISAIATQWSYDGQGNSIRNLYVVGAQTIGSTSTGTGLFGTMTGAISNIVLVDPVVIGGTYTGALVGSMKGPAVTNCGVYLEPDSAGSYSAVTARCTVSAYDGSVCVGGLIGDCGGATVTTCFAAINVLPVANGSITETGGLIGRFLTESSSAISNSYASGDVTASSVAGGLVGEVYGASQQAWDTQSGISDCYSTSDVTADTRGGGLIGESLSTRPTITGSAAYGYVTTSSGDLDLQSSGGFIGYDGAGGATLVGCSYLSQTGYNDSYANPWDGAGLAATSYDDMANAATNTLTAANSHPYDSALASTAFPFTPVLANHYGDWPVKVEVKPTLVYYEKYQHTSSDDTVTYSYGYYAANTSTASASSLGELALDTLETGEAMAASGDIVVEDGYALMTSSAVDSGAIGYSLNGGQSSTFQVSTTPTDDANTLVALTSAPVPLTLTSTGDASTAVTQAYLYQLPFALQEPDRTSGSSSFYDDLTLTMPSQQVYTYYYCGDFAETSINPDANGSTSAPKAGDLTVLVRSARQLNALGQRDFYWNTDNSNGWTLRFEQGCDISFSDYVTTYCSQPFDLTSTTGTYGNKPIGTVDDAFSFDYDGGTVAVRDYNHDAVSAPDAGYEIRDYCLVSGDQFVGLFGEASGGTIGNVHLTSSTTGTASASVVSTYSATGASGTGAVGALVGLLSVYSGSTGAQVSNCSVVGYRVEFTNDDARGHTAMDSYNAAAGGLVGYNMGVVSGSLADNYVVRITAFNQKAPLESIGGLVGSNAGTIANSTVLSDRVPSGASELQYRVNTGTSKATVSFGGIAGRYYAQWTDVTLTASISGSTSRCIMTSAAAAAGTQGTVEYYGIANGATGNMGNTGTYGNSLKGYAIDATNAFNRGLIFTTTPDSSRGTLR